MTAQGKANYEAWRASLTGRLHLDPGPPPWAELSLAEEGDWDAGADAVALVLADDPGKTARKLEIALAGLREVGRICAEELDERGPIADAIEETAQAALDSIAELSL